MVSFKQFHSFSCLWCVWPPQSCKIYNMPLITLNRFPCWIRVLKENILNCMHNNTHKVVVKRLLWINKCWLWQTDKTISNSSNCCFGTWNIHYLHWVIGGKLGTSNAVDNCGHDYTYFQWQIENTMIKVKYWFVLMIFALFL